jgi:hypothetical protein
MDRSWGAAITARSRGFCVESEEKIGWGGRIRTFTVLINSEVSYQLDHAPAGGQNIITRRTSLLPPVVKTTPSALYDGDLAER